MIAVSDFAPVFVNILLRVHCRAYAGTARVISLTPTRTRRGATFVIIPQINDDILVFVHLN